jgi:hypothetical protein
MLILADSASVTSMHPGVGGLVGTSVALWAPCAMVVLGIRLVMTQESGARRAGRGGRLGAGAVVAVRRSRKLSFGGQLEADELELERLLAAIHRPASTDVRRAGARTVALGLRSDGGWRARAAHRCRRHASPRRMDHPVTAPRRACGLAVWPRLRALDLRRQRRRSYPRRDLALAKRPPAASPEASGRTSSADEESPRDRLRRHRTRNEPGASPAQAQPRLRMAAQRWLPRAV